MRFLAMVITIWFGFEMGWWVDRLICRIKPRLATNLLIRTAGLAVTIAVVYTIVTLLSLLK